MMSAAQLVATNQVMPPKPLIQSHTITAKSARKYELTLNLTGDGKKALRAHESIRLKLSITFLPSNGKAANRILNLTLEK